MNPAHWHLLINHTPVFAIMGGAFLLTASYIFRYPAARTIAIFFFIAGAIVSPMANQTGEGAEEQLETAGLEEAWLEPHEEAAETAVILGIACGILAIASLLLEKRQSSYSRWIFLVLLLAGWAALAAMSYTAWTGGMVRHTEIRNGAVKAAPAEKQDED